MAIPYSTSPVAKCNAARCCAAPHCAAHQRFVAYRRCASAACACVMPDARLPVMEMSRTCELEQARLQVDRAAADYCLRFDYDV